MRRLAMLIAIALLGSLPTAPASASPPRAAMLSGTGMWVGVKDASRRSPVALVQEAERLGVTVIFVETTNAARRAPVVDPAALRRLVAVAHASGLRIVPWFQPSLQRTAQDRQRLMAAVRLGGAEVVDGIGVDLRSTQVKDPRKRAARAQQTMAWLRQAAPRMPIGAVVPAVGTRDAQRFPYVGVHAASDVLLPLCTPPRRAGAARVTSEMVRCVDTVRAQSGDPAAEVHVVGGCPRGASAAQLEATARGALDAGAIGFSVCGRTADYGGGAAALALWSEG